MLDNSEIKIEELNDTYYRLADLIGLEDTIKVAELLGGMQFRLRKNYNLDYDYQDIVNCIGKTKTNILLKGFPGEYVSFSTWKQAIKKQVYAKIRKEFTGYNQNELARKYGYSTFAIRNIVAKKWKE